MAEVNPRPCEGRAVQIVKINEDNTFELNEDALCEIVNDERVKDKPVAVISVAGAFRKGKSFLLNFMIRYLKAKGSENWLGSDDAPLTGFNWRAGSERETTGIIVWSEVLLINTLGGREVAVLLMDTQGAFDSESTLQDCATIFALSTLISSVQVFNLSQNIQEDNLQYLQFFAKYGQLAIENSGHKPFQKLMFLVRDWSNSFETPYGEDGGQKFLDKRLAVSRNQRTEQKVTREDIKACFESISCFLLPYPGETVAEDPEFRGRLADIRPEFKTQLNSLLPVLLAPSNIVVKKIGSSEISTKELLTYFQTYMAIYKNGTCPEANTVFEATAKADHLNAVAASMECYMLQMDKICGSFIFKMPATLNGKHKEVKENALAEFTSRKKMGRAELSEEYRKKLDKEIETSFIGFKNLNNAKIQKAQSAALAAFNIALGGFNIRKLR